MLSHGGLRTLALVEIAAPVAMYFGRIALSGKPADAAALWQMAAMALVGVLTLAASAWNGSRRHARLLAAISAWGAPALLVATALWKPAASSVSADYMLAEITAVALTAVATVPFQPWHTLAWGLGVEAVYVLAAEIAARRGIPYAAAHSDAHIVFLTMLALLATGIASANYQHRREEFGAHQEAVRVAEALTGAQLRAELAENAISIGKLAAALTHELNSPMGALRSSIATLLALTDRQVDAPPPKRELLSRMRAELSRSIQESAERIDDVMERLGRLVNLSEGELRSADINELLSEVTLLHQEEIQAAGVRLEFDLQKPLPSLRCRPQLLSAVFSSLLANAIQAVNGDGRIRISSRLRDGELEVTIQDNGRGMSAEQADNVFDPSLRVSGNRVSSGNWSLFNARQIVYQHGGEIQIETAEGKGAAFHVTFPVDPG